MLSYALLHSLWQTHTICLAGLTCLESAVSNDLVQPMNEHIFNTEKSSRPMLNKIHFWKCSMIQLLQITALKLVFVFHVLDNVKLGSVSCRVMVA